MRLQHEELMNPSPVKSDAAPGGRTAPQNRKKTGVLVVDDEHLVRIMVCLGLERMGFDVWVASNGREAIDLFGEHRDDIAVVLLDVLMPGLDGLQTMTALREQNPDIPVCFMSGDTGNRKPSELVQRDGVSFIAKPFLLDDLANILRLLIHGLPYGLPIEPCSSGRERQGSRLSS